MTAPGLGAVDELCRLAVAARRLGYDVHLAGTDGTLQELLDLAGVADQLPRCPALPLPAGAPMTRSDLRCET